MFTLSASAHNNFQFPLSGSLLTEEWVPAPGYSLSIPSLGITELA